MGYLTYHKLNWKDTSAPIENSLRDKVIANMGQDAQELLKYLPISKQDKICEYIDTHEDIKYAIKSDEGCKWYEHEDDMRRMSENFPDVLFTLNGEGEESGDIWIEYYLDGKMQREDAQIVFGEFNEEKLR